MLSVEQEKKEATNTVLDRDFYLSATKWIAIIKKKNKKQIAFDCNARRIIKK